MHFQVYFQTLIKFKQIVFCFVLRIGYKIIMLVFGVLLNVFNPKVPFFGDFLSAHNKVHNIKHLNIYTEGTMSHM